MDQAKLNQLLEAGEAIIWTGQPSTCWFLSQRQGWSIAAWTLLLVVSAFLAPALISNPLSVWGLLAGGGLVWLAWDTWRLGRWLVRRRGEFYAITTRRILVLERDCSLRGSLSLLRSHEIRRAPSLHVLDTLILGPDRALFQGHRLDTRPSSDAPRLSGIAGGESVLAIIHKATADREIEWTNDDGTDG